jgi:hypothetical protein
MKGAHLSKHALDVLVLSARERGAGRTVEL